MLVSKMACPICKTVLKPAKPLPGEKKVKCPKCATDFMASEGDVEKQPAQEAKADPVPTPKKKAVKPVVPKAAPKVEAKAAPKAEAKAAPKKPADDDDDEDSGGTYSISEADRPKEKGDPDDEDDPGKVDFIANQELKDLRGPAQAAVMKPSNMLILNGSVGFFGWLLLLVVQLLPVIFPVLEEEDEVGKDAPPKQALTFPAGVAAVALTQDPTRPKDADKPEEPKQSLYMLYIWDLSLLAMYPWYIYGFTFIPHLLGLAYAAALTYGAVKMQNLESRTWGVVASCLCMFPYATGGFIVLCSMVVTLVMTMVSGDVASLTIVLVALIVLESLGCVAIGVMSLMTLNQPAVIDGYAYISEV